MPASDSESDYFDDGDFVIPDDDFPDDSRESKRRRVQPPTRETENDDGQSTDAFSDMEEDIIKDLETPGRGETQRFSSKLKSFVPKRPNPSENLFVTQLTQTHSSPERIRGPKWQKPSPSHAPQVASIPNKNGGDSSDEFPDDDDDLRAAMAASLESFEEDKALRSGASNVQSRTSQTTNNNNSFAQDEFDLDDIPDGAFDSSPPPARPAPAVQRPVFQSNVYRMPHQYKQTTLYGMVAQNPELSLQEQDPGPPQIDEPPTHHKLNKDELDKWWYPINLGKIRDYQFNITQKALFHNMLVALPTGLGKTFIAATVMLNWFRWTQDAQIVFVAPTKPLVSQQVSACLNIAGIPRSQVTMLTGGASPGIRAEEWKSKRIFFMTPQTMVNDIKTGIADPKRIVLLVVDEAHRATGAYSYVEVVKQLGRFNNSFRVLALTATPGSTVETVQEVINGLNISRVEIRTEESLDIREYVHARNIDLETFENSEEMEFCLDLLSRTLQPMVDQLKQLNAYWQRDPLSLTAFGLTKARQQWMMSDAGRNASMGVKGMINQMFTLLASVAHGLDLLKYHGIVPFYRHMIHFKSNDGKKPGKYLKQIVENEHFKKLLQHVDPWSKAPDFIGHPKLEYLKSVILNHFMDAGEGEEQPDGTTRTSTRVMIFVHFRDSAEEVTRVLKRYDPMIRPHIFVGQSSAKGHEGMNQKTQLDIINKFKNGTYNTLVATSIGEEGLDIGEVDRIVCYDSSASPIRMLQRMGRTGRKRAGNITLLVMKGKEEDSYIKAKDNYEKMQQMIASGTRFTFHADRSARILPAGIRPVADKRIVEIPLENSQQEMPEPKRKGRAPKRPPKVFHMPDNVETGFTRASTLGDDGAPKKKAKKATKASKAPTATVPKKRALATTPEPVEIPSPESICLPRDQQKIFDDRLEDSGPIEKAAPHIGSSPRQLHPGRVTEKVFHSSTTNRTVAALQTLGNFNPSTEDRYQQILKTHPLPDFDDFDDWDD